jgi:hypothetical protein
VQINGKCRKNKRRENEKDIKKEARKKGINNNEERKAR